MPVAILHRHRHVLTYPKEHRQPLHTIQSSQSRIRSCFRSVSVSAMPSDADGSGIVDVTVPQQQQGTVAVRQLRASDKERWLKLFKDYIQWYKAQVPDDVIEQTWQNIMAGGDGNHIALVAVDSSSKVIGLAHILLHKSTWSKTHYCYLEDLYVEQQVQAQGVGKALIEAVYQTADDLGATKTYWQTHECNYRARGLYDKMGKKSEFILYQRN